MTMRPDIVLYTAPTMNGWKPLIFLHEAEVAYELVAVDFSKKEQKAPAYLKLNPNGRIPTVVDRSAGDFAVFESGAILWYLAEKFFQVGHVGPMMGQAMYFQRIARPNGHDDPFAIRRYVDESRRLLEVLDTRLEGRDFLVGDYSIADMATFPWARSFFWAGVDVAGLQHLNAWFARIDARPATQAALQLPKPRPSVFGPGV